MAYFVLWIVLGVGGAVIANSKNRSWVLGAVLGLGLGVIGLVIVACLKASDGSAPVHSSFQLTRSSATPALAAASLPPAGWYSDPGDPGRMRWWGGQAWTDHVAVRDDALVRA
jgi:hypothetical protein